MERTEPDAAGHAAGSRGFGVAGSLARPAVHAVAREAEAAGYHSFWTNDGPDGEGLAALHAAAEATHTIRLGVGVIPLDRRSPEHIAQRIGELDLPVERLTVGVGAGGAPGGLARVRDGVLALRGLLAATVVVGALGPRTSRLAGRIADGLFIDWPTPAHARTVIEQIARVAAEASRPRPPVLGYVFTALGAAARQRLRAEADHYGAIAAYVAHFRRMDVTPDEATVGGDTAEQIQRGLSAFTAVLDVTVVRATVGEDTVADHLDLLTAAAPS